MMFSVFNQSFTMERNSNICLVLILMLSSVFADFWRRSAEERQLARNVQRGIHSHSKRHMMPEMEDKQELRNDIRLETRSLEANKRRIASPRNRKKPTGHLTPLLEDDMDNDEVVSVAIGPPPMRPKYDKLNWKHPAKAPKVIQTTPSAVSNTQGATNLVKDILMQLGREFLTHQVSEDFIFGQYIGNAMKNITSDLKLKMQHEILELVVRYQNLNRGEPLPTSTPTAPIKIEDRVSIRGDVRAEKKITGNETDEAWPDFSNLAKIVG